MWHDLNSNKMKSSFQLQLDLYLVENPVKIELTVPEIYPLLWCSNNEIHIRKLNSNICCVWKSILASSDSFCLISWHMIIIFSIDNFDYKFNFTNSFQVPSFTMVFFLGQEVEITFGNQGSVISIIDILLKIQVQIHVDKYNIYIEKYILYAKTHLIHIIHIRINDSSRIISEKKI